MSQTYQSRIIVHPEGIDTTGFTNENSLVRAMQDRPDTLVPAVTMLMGAWHTQFPLSFMTEGQGFLKKEAINHIEYDYPVMGKRVTTSRIKASPYTAGNKPGVGHSDIKVTFDTHLFKKKALVMTPDNTLLQVRDEGLSVPGGGVQLSFRLVDPNPASFLALDQLTPGTVWGLTGGSPVSNSRSFGTQSTTQYPGKRKNQISILRKSYEMAGNITNRVVEFQFYTEGGKMSRYWVDFEEYQHMLAWKEECETHLWVSEYNRDNLGVIPLTDPDTGLPVPMGAGMFQQIRSNTTYSVFTETLLRTILGDVFRGAPDTGMMDVVLYTGTGGFDSFDLGMKDSTLFSLIAESGIGSNFVKSKAGGLNLGGYFRSYEHVEGHTITLKKLPMLDHGGYADRSARHPVTGRPLSSYEMYFVDQSTYDGIPNLRMVHQEGRLEIRGLHQGMTLLKGSNFGDYKGNGRYVNLATPQDATSIHFMSTKGICMLRDTHTFALKPASNFVG
jgi:hypothetical protein